MNVQFSKSNNSVNFQSIYKIHIPHGVFKHPDDMAEVANTFDDISAKKLEHIPCIVNKALRLLGQKVQLNTFRFFEQPLYIDDAAKKGFHTFFIATKKHKNMLVRLYNDVMSIGAKVFNESFRTSKEKQILGLPVRLNNKFKKGFKAIIAKEPVETIKVGSLEDLEKELAKKVKV